MNNKIEKYLSKEFPPLVPLALLDEYNDFNNPDLREVLKATCIRRYLEGSIKLLLKDEILQRSGLSEETWDGYNLNNKIQAIGKYYDKEIESLFHRIRKISNEGPHFDGEITSKEVEEGIELVTLIIEKILISYFKRNPIGSQMPILTMLSSLPPRSRIYILEELFKGGQDNLLVIDKLSMAYLKDGNYLKCLSFLEEQKNNKVITDFQFDEFVEKINVLRQHVDKFSSAQNVLDVKATFEKIVNSYDYNTYKEFTSIFLVLISGYGFQN